MSTKILFVQLLLASMGLSIAQAQITVDIPITKDAFIERNEGNAARANMNFGTHQMAPAQATTNNGNLFIRRYIFDTDLSSLPSNIIINSVELYFFGNGNHLPNSYYNDNDATLEEVTGTWIETGTGGITWNNENLTATGESVYVPPSNTSGTNIVDLDYVIDVTSIVADNFSSGSPITSFRLRLITEQRWTRLIFRSSDHPTLTDRPFVRINYSLPVSYAELRDNLDGSYYKCKEGQLNLKFNERYYSNGGSLDLSLYDVSDNLVYQPSLTHATGINLYEIDLLSTTLFLDGAFYVAKAVDIKGNTQYLRFQYNE